MLGNLGCMVILKMTLRFLSRRPLFEDHLSVSCDYVFIKNLVKSKYFISERWLAHNTAEMSSSPAAVVVLHLNFRYRACFEQGVL